MNVALLSLEQTPPLSVPFRFFLTAPLFGLAAAALLLWAGPEVLDSRWEPALLAVTHLLTLGFMALVMMGAVFQLLPVLAGVQIPHPHVWSALVHVPAVLGAVVLSAGFVVEQALWFRIALPLLLLAIGLFIIVAARALWNAASVHDTVCGLKLAVVSLALTLLFGLHLGLGHAEVGMMVPRRLTDIHLAWGMLGWGGLLLVGVAYQVVPMFQVTAPYPSALRRWLGWSLLSLLIAWSLATAQLPAVAWLPGLGLAAGFMLFAVYTLWLQHKRLRRLPDVTVDFWRLAMGSMLAAALLWLVHGLLPQSLRSELDLIWGIVLLIGGAVSVISGMLYKIVPFLVWLHLNNYLQGEGRWQGSVPNMRQVIGERAARRHLWLHGTALALLLGAVFLPRVLFYPAVLVLGAAFALQFWNLFSAVRVYRSVVSQAGAR